MLVLCSKSTTSSQVLPLGLGEFFGRPNMQVCIFQGVSFMFRVCGFAGGGLEGVESPASFIHSFLSSGNAPTVYCIVVYCTVPVRMAREYTYEAYP